MNRKKASVILPVSAVLIVSIVMGVVMAVLIAKTERRVNEFTFGNAEIDLTEDKWDKLTSDDKIVYPNRIIEKDPKVTNLGETDLYIFIEVQVPRTYVEIVNEDENIEDADWRDLFSYEINDGWKLIESSVSDDKTTAVYVYAYTKTLSAGETTETLFDSVQYLNIVEGQLEKGSTLSMPISAYAVQVGYLNEQGDNFEEKMLDAYSKYKAEVNKR